MNYNVMCGVTPANITRLIIDTEFNGRGGCLISLAMVSLEAGNHFYEVLEHAHQEINPWVTEHVLPELRRDALPLVRFLKEVQVYLDQFMFVEFIYSNVSDRLYLDEVLKALKSVPMHRMCHDRHLSARKAKVPHNALSDALAMVDEIYGSTEINEWGLSERDVMAELLKAGFPYDRRHVVLTYKASDWQLVAHYGHKRRIVKVTYTFNPKATQRESVHGQLTLNFTVTHMAKPQVDVTAQGYLS